MQQKNKLLIEKVIFQAQLEYKIFQKYENMWPVLQLEKKATSNLEDPLQLYETQCRIGKQKAEEICGDKESDIWDANEDASIIDFDCLHSETDSLSEASDNDISEDPSEDGHNSDDDNEDNDMVPVKRKSTNLPASEIIMNIQVILEKKKCKEVSEDEHGGESDEDNNLAPVKRKSITPASLEHTKHSKMSKPSGNSSGTLQTTVGHSIKIMNVRLPPSEDEDKDDTDYHNLTATDDCPITSHQLLKMCPGMDCKDAIPNSISNQLKTALSTYIGLIKERKTNIHLEMDISLKDAEAKGWPAMKIKFKDIPSHILEMYDELKKLLFDVEAHKNLWLWTCFEADLEVNHYTLAQFAQINMGKLMLQIYLTYFVIPHVICQFVTQDFSLLLTMPMHNIMVESNNVGKLINPKHDDDDELNQIKHAMTFALKQRNLKGQTIHDAAKALVALQYAKTTDVLGTSGMHFLL
ncbi:hypothetical protein F5J12DRAFT_786173 [Pisolithus orientalis]|uniref:uncharacterized protein n=1 Tax=Pisolithus orientalis TaxID=936130 RepID=UPI002224C2A3|nr:uncharacterized protein F5J12DRAFT_786173 [Pisolithus orientalis]KAI5992381.1 hypothetical protein F5J12DRAFT_786173 [Pisolithus orientalis]